MENSQAPWRQSFLMDQICFSYFVEGHPVTISTKLFWILTNSEEKYFKVIVNAISHTPWRPYFLKD